MTFYVIGRFSDESAMVLNLEGYDKRERAERAINWQKKGQGTFDDWHICKRVGPVWFKSESGLIIEARQSPYNNEAWERFKAEWE